jgi:hypothetical protein
MLGQMALEGSFGLLANALPKYGLKTGMALGGARGETEKAVEAFLRERARSGPFESIPLARTSREVAPKPPGTAARTADWAVNRQNVQRRINEQGAKLEDIEKSSAIRTPISTLMGSTRGAQGAAKSGVSPFTAGLEFKQGEREFLQQQSVRKWLEDKLGIPFESLTEQQLAAGLRAAQKAGPRQMNNLEFNMRDLGDIRRTTGRQAEPIINARAMKQPVDFDPTMKGPAVAEGIHSRSRELQDLLLPEQIPVNKRLADLFTIRNTNDTLRGGGGIMSDVGQLSTRGGLAHGVTQSIGRITQTEGGPLRRMANFFGVAGLAPSVLSRAGYAGGTAAGLAPSILRTANPADDNDIIDLIKSILEEGDTDNKPSIMRGVSLRKPS